MVLLYLANVHLVQNFISNSSLLTRCLCGTHKRGRKTLPCYLFPLCQVLKGTLAPLHMEGQESFPAADTPPPNMFCCAFHYSRRFSHITLVLLTMVFFVSPLLVSLGRFHTEPYLVVGSQWPPSGSAAFRLFHMTLLHIRAPGQSSVLCSWGVL